MPHLSHRTPIQIPQFRTPHGIASNQPITGTRPKETKLGASKARKLGKTIR